MCKILNIIRWAYTEDEDGPTYCPHCGSDYCDGHCHQR
jgi:hypothetical protein